MHTYTHTYIHLPISSFPLLPEHGGRHVFVAGLNGVVVENGPLQKQKRTPSLPFLQDSSSSLFIPEGVEGFKALGF